MPFEVDDGPVLPRRPQQAVIPDKPDPSLLDTLGAAFRQDNVVLNAIRAIGRPQFEEDPHHNPLDMIRDTKFEERHLDRFVGSRSAAETQAIMGRIEEEEQDRRILDASGAAGFIAQVGAEMLDPTIALPGGALYRGVRAGEAAVKSAASVGAAAAVQTAAQETVLQSLQETRSLGESAVNVGSATILGGMIGAGASALLSRVEREALEKSLDHTRAEMDAHAAGMPAPAAPTKGFDAFHGSSKDFDRFDLSVSENAPFDPSRGVNALGRGVYLSDTEDVAKGYTPRKGTLYKVRVDVDPDEFYQKGKPLSEQSPSVQAALANVDQMEIGGQKVGYSATRLREAGIPGVISDEAGGRTIVVFDENAVRITEKNGKPVTTAVPASLGSGGVGASVGAAATDTRGLTMVGHGLGMTDFVSPLRKSLSIDDDVIKRDIVDLVEPPYRFEENLAGQATSQAPSVQRMATQAINGLRATVGDDLSRLFADYRFGQPDTNFPGARAQYERFRGTDGGKMTRGEFNRSVSEALMFGDKHDIPQVQQAAQLIRQRVFEPWAARMEKVIPEFKRSEAESYFPHYWNKELIRARRPEFVNKITEHYQADQTKKAAAKERLQWSAAQLRSWEQQITKLDARFGRIEDRIDGLETRTAERGMEANATEARAETVEARQGRIADEAAELDIAISLMEDIGRNHPTLGPVLRRTEAMLETRSRQHDTVGAVADEARRGERRNFKRLDVLKERLSDAEQRKALIEEYRAAAQQMHDEVRAKIEAEIAAWEGKSSTEAKQALKAREKYAAEREAAAKAKGEPAPTNRLKAADDAIDRAVKRIIESDRDLSVQELRSRANETVNRILGSPDGRLPYDMASGGPRMGVGASDELRGSAAAREFAVSNAWAREWLEDDVEQVMALYLRTMVPDTLIAERFGDVNMEQVFRRINEQYDRRIDATGPSAKERKRLDKEKNMVIENVAAFRDRIRGTYGWSQEASAQNMARYGNAAKLLNNVTSMGVSAISSLPDMAGTVFRWGMGAAFRDGWSPFMRSLMDKEMRAEWGQHKGQMRALGIGIETATNARQNAIDDVMDVYRPQSKWERALQYGSDKFFIANLLAPETDLFKTIASHVAMSELLKGSAAVRAGNVTQKQLEILAENSIDRQMAQRIADQFEQHGGISEKGVRLTNLADWTDRAAADSLAGAIGRETDIAVVTPGQEKPKLFSRPGWSVLSQFKNFTASANERILIANLQRRDANTLQGLTTAIALGMLSYKINSFFGGQETSDKPADWFREGVTRAGILGWLEEGNAMASKVGRGQIDIHRLYGAEKPASRYVSRSAVDMLLGPTAGKLKDAFQVTGSGVSGDWSESDTKALRRMMATQNLFYLRGLFNQVEQGANAKLGIQ
jgi:hypothetical protein